MIQIDAYYDMLCPFCFLAKRSLEIAQTKRPQINIEIDWKPFMLHPEFPRGPHDFRATFVGKYGNEARIPMWDHVIATGRKVGIEFAFYDIKQGFHSIHAHRLVHKAKQVGTETDVIEALFSAFYESAIYLGDAETLADIGAKHGLEREAILAYLQTQEDEAEIFALTESYKHDLGITGMPFYTLNGDPFKPHETGPDAFINALDAHVLL